MVKRQRFVMQNYVIRSLDRFISHSLIQPTWAAYGPHLPILESFIVHFINSIKLIECSSSTHTKKKKTAFILLMFVAL